jgi:hypothetical protein
VIAEWDDSCSELAKTIERELLWKVREAQNDAIQWGVDADLEGSLEAGWPGVPSDLLWPDLLLEEPLRTHSWPSIDGGARVKVEVHSVVDRVEGHSAYRCL